ncbi:MAG: tetratricopeptide repeat protein, partial [Chloroflexi bacterium]|nr:tetratricopeptide repeat protein [Chloroflexota bacterium]
MAPISLAAYIAQARSHLQSGNLEEAREILDHLATFYPQHIELQRLRGELALAQEDFAAAAEHFRRVVEMDPEQAAAHLALASLIEEDDVLAAIGHLERARELDPGNQEISRNLARLYTLRDGEE